MPPSSQTSITTSIDDRMIAAMRLVLAASALLITYMDPLEPSRLVAVTYAALLLYTAYSGVLYALALRRTSFIPAEITHWVDVGWYVALIGLSSGTNSMFFYFFFFSILVASFQWGLASGLRVTLASAVFFTSIGLATAPVAAEFELNRFLLRPIYLLALGYMTAYWGGSEIALKRRLTLLKDVSRLSNPRFGVDRTLGMIVEQLR
ncbi:MAG: histidine kinase, partial [Nitrospinae bacterium]|nr:histidine kinase [Nitrospinota bacterium]